MTLQKLVEQKFKDVPFIGIYEEIDGKIQPICPEYADELLETHGEMEVKDYTYVGSKSTLVIEFKED